MAARSAAAACSNDRTAGGCDTAAYSAPGHWSYRSRHTTSSLASITYVRTRTPPGATPLPTLIGDPPPTSMISDSIECSSRSTTRGRRFLIDEQAALELSGYWSQIAEMLETPPGPRSERQQRLTVVYSDFRPFWGCGWATRPSNKDYDLRVGNAAPAIARSTGPYGCGRSRPTPAASAPTTLHPTRSSLRPSDQVVVRGHQRVVDVLAYLRSAGMRSRKGLSLTLVMARRSMAVTSAVQPSSVTVSPG